MKQTKRIGEVYNVESICITKDDLDDVSMRRTVCSNLQRFFVSLWAMAIRRTTIHTISHMQNRKATETVISENCSMCLENEIKSQNNEKYNRTKKKRAKIHFYLIANSHWNDDLCQSSAHLVLNRVKQRKRTENVVAFNYILLIKTETNKRSSCICVCVCVRGCLWVSVYMLMLSLLAIIQWTLENIALKADLFYFDQHYWLERNNDHVFVYEWCFFLRLSVLIVYFVWDFVFELLE